MSDQKVHAHESDIAQQAKRLFQKQPVPKVLKGKTRFEMELLLNPSKLDKHTVEQKAQFEEKFEQFKQTISKYSNVAIQLKEAKRPVFRDEPRQWLMLYIDVNLPILDI